ncbi:MAG: lysylphosphatidylglycerol synthase transmembrane domain-containing protein [bacterium]|nr:lysylphosphatidylglycerol synthase transmembrane domain-containing protein [bacterium]
MKKLKIILPILISCLFLYLAARNLDFVKAARVFCHINYLYLFIGFLATVAAFAIRVIRWQVILSPTKRMGIYRLGSSFLIGLTVNNILPARIGELVRAYVLGEKENVSKSLILATIILERILDTIAVFTFLALLLFISPIPENIKKTGLFIFGACLLILIFLFLLKTHKRWTIKQVEKISLRFSKIIENFSEGLSVLSSKRKILLLSFYSILSWLIAGFSIHLFLLSIGIFLPLHIAFFVLVMTVIGVMIPAAPGYIGTFHYFCILALQIFGQDKEIAASFSILLYLVNFIPTTLFGIACLFIEGLSFSKILSLKK